MEADFLLNLGDTFDVTDDVVQNLLIGSPNRMLHMEPSMEPMDALADDGMGPSDNNSLSVTSDFRLNGFSAIHLAAYYGKFPIIRSLLFVCPENVDLLNHLAQTPLHIAASEGHVEATTEILSLGANPILQDIDGRTPLHLAVLKGHLDVARLLLDGTHSQSMIRMSDGAGKTCLHHAVLQERDDIVRLLLERGADPRTPVGSG